MTDRDLMKLAAKAAGIKLHWCTYHNQTDPNDGYWAIPRDPPFNRRVTDGGIMWNPLTDDGDALRLASKLRIGIGDRETTVTAFHKQSMSIGRVYIEEYDVRDKAAATRRAIVRAAAAIGEKE